MSETLSLIEPIKDIQEVNITDDGIYEELLKRSGGRLCGDTDAIRKFEPIYGKLHTLGLKLGQSYAEIATRYGSSPGRIDVVLGGGRAKGKPFKEDSDLDIFFYIDNPLQSLGYTRTSKYPEDPMEALIETTVKTTKFRKEIGKICEGEGVADEFHVIGWGAKFPEHYDQETQIILARII